MNWLEKIAGIVVQLGSSVPPMPIVTGGDKVFETATGSEIIEIVKTALTTLYNRIDPQGGKFLAARYQFIVDEWNNSHYEWLVLKLHILPLGGKRGTEEIPEPGSDLYDYYQKYHGGKTGRTVYKTPQDAIKEIPADPALAYRGMAWEEWQSIRQKGVVQSRGTYNLGDEQNNYTLFGTIPATGQSYAHSFAPLQYQTSFKRPSVIISVPKNILLTHQDAPQAIPDSELGYKGSLPSSYIQDAWMLVPTDSRTKGGEMELRFLWVPTWERGEQPTGMFKIDPKLVQTGSGIHNVITGYAIRKLK